MGTFAWIQPVVITHSFLGQGQTAYNIYICDMLILPAISPSFYEQDKAKQAELRKKFVDEAVPKVSLCAYLYM